ncbi:cell division protease FtsH [Geosporobacter subterraneus DSM 17957]|uniref:ATP-dependent zinc metalloprotease FtsH n=1 Tax=Geosporobacter subterraneus DSM 17957 TaxID=1121919 RepID=A0A1M6LUN1_9FIRM|nr:ATP-dependent zinc metalloprotease FtsH [Geosporobacter subterraneus]SHJ74896.1 cell division protease FtsH [Geosporobacter subterraneus DSM 17957]
MKKKKIVLTALYISIFTTIVLTLGSYSGSPILGGFGSISRLMLIFASTSLFLYYMRMNQSPELEPAHIKNEKREKDDKKNNRPDRPSTRFVDVAGLDEVKEELVEIIDFINNPEKYHSMGAKIPKGILFYGPPGTGKTLLAQALAGETDSAFFPASGSEFVEKYVGVGAKRVRTLFEKAKKEAPSVIFIDEIDAIGAKRTTESNNEKDQTLNQLLIEMDGFSSSQTVIVIGATNRLDLLDEALLRPGRFDRHMFIGNPDVRAREEIFKVHIKNKPIDAKVDIKNLAKRTHGMSGAHLSNIANEAAILAVRNNKKNIGIDEFNQAIEKVIAGLQKKNAVILEKEKKTVSYHEAGHALVGKILNTDLVAKISIIPRGEALGYVMYAPEEDRYLITKEELYNKIKVLLGGRAAEEIIFGEVSTGAKDDLKKANNLAYQMVCEYGMSNLGNRVFEPAIIKSCYGMIDTEIKSIIDSCYDESLKQLRDQSELLHEVAQALLEKETLTGEELDTIIQAHRQKNYSIAT